jgi:hypothetical protein
LPEYSTIASHGEFVAGTPSIRVRSLPLWVTKTIEIVGIDPSNINDSRKTRGQKQHGSVALLAHGLEARGFDTYVNKAWELVPRLQGNNVVNCPWV